MPEYKIAALADGSSAKLFRLLGIKVFSVPTQEAFRAALEQSVKQKEYHLYVVLEKFVAHDAALIEEYQNRYGIRFLIVPEHTDKDTVARMLLRRSIVRATGTEIAAGDI